MRRVSSVLCLILCLSTTAVTCASETDILSAAEQGDLETVKQLLADSSQLISITDARGYTPLHKAVYNGHLELATFLLAQGAAVDARSQSGSTPLHGAAAYGHTELVRFLISQRADLNVANTSGYTPLLGALSGNQSEIARILIEAGAEITSGLPDGRTPLSMALFNADFELTKLLLSRGAPTDVSTSMGVSLPFFALAYRTAEYAPLFIDHVSDIDETDRFGLTLLHFAAARGFEEQINLLLDRGANPNAADSLGRTPLFYASLWGYDEISRRLRNLGATSPDLDEPWFKGDYLGRPAPGKTPALLVGDELRTPFAPHGTLTFSPDGNEMFWCHQAMPIQAMWYLKKTDGQWQKPIIAPFTDPALDYADGNPSFSADGNRVYYHSRRPYSGEPREDGQADIWYVEKTEHGWGAPIWLGPPVNTEKGEYNPSVARSGNLYFIGNEYDDTFGAGDIYVAELVDGSYLPPVNLGPSINSPQHELSPVPAPDESYLVFTSNRPGPRGRNLTLYVSYKLPDGGWSQSVSLGRTVNQGQAWRPSITADGKYVIYQRGSDYFWFSTALIEDLRREVVGDGPESTDLPKPKLRLSEQIFEYTATNDIALGDLDGDGDLDAVFSNMHDYGSRVYLNDGTGGFTQTDQVLTDQGHGVDLGDLDADGDLDIAISCAEHGYDLMIYFNDGEAVFTRQPQNLGDSLPSANNVTLIDIDSDGDLDASVVYYQHDDKIFLNDGHGHFADFGITVPDGIFWAHLNGDDHIDYLWRQDGIGFKSFINDGAGNFTQHWSKSDSAVHRGGVAFGDFDNDGDPDAVVAFDDRSEHRYSTLWYNDGTGAFSESEVRLPLTRFARMSTGDFNGDSHLDVFLNNFGAPSAVWLGDGAGGLFDSGIRFPGVWLNTTCPTGDVDGDGDLDIFISAFGGGPNELWFND